MPGTWRPITNPTHPLPRDIKRVLLLTNGMILCHKEAYNWSMFSPDNTGKYLNGTWFSELTRDSRSHFGGCTLSDGRALIAYGWPDNYPVEIPPDRRGDLTIEIFNPRAPYGRRWTILPANPGWPALNGGPVQICPLADGRHVLIGAGQITRYGLDSTRRSTLFDTVTNTCRLVDPGTTEDAFRQGWTLLSDGTVFSTNGRYNDFRYLPDAGTGRWMSIPKSHPGMGASEWEGHGLLLPDGRVWVPSTITADTMFYHPPARSTDTGTWSAGPGFPNIEGGGPPVTDRFVACLLPSGIVLCAVNVSARWDYDARPVFYEFDPFNGDTITQVSRPELIDKPAIWGEQPVMILLPTGEVLMFYYGDGFIYTPAADSREPQPAWRPHLTAPTGVLIQENQYTATGTLFNGMSQAIANAPDKSNGTATNFPIIRLANLATGTVVYPGNYGHTMGVATGSSPQSTNFRVPADFPEGEADLSVIANGIESNRIRVTIIPRYKRFRDPYREVMQVIGSLADGPLFILGPGGIRPFPPFGPLDLKFEKMFRERILKAYENIFTGLLLMSDLNQDNTDDKDDLLINGGSRHEHTRSRIEYGLHMLRQLGEELDMLLNKAEK
ncbi:MAG: hypothetical protein ACJ749_08915 [Flavisolibacter sp.]